MSSSSLAGTAAAPQTMTAARWRLWLGITCVGTQVLLSVFSIATQLPAQILPETSQPFAQELMRLAGFFGLTALIMLPFDIAGGWFLPRRFEGSKQTLPLALYRIGRGALVQVLTFTTILFVYRLIGAAIGVWGVVLTFVAMQFILLSSQTILARCVATFHQKSCGSCHPPVITFTGQDRAFTGGVAGLPGFDSIVLPGHWEKSLPTYLCNIAVYRRMFAIRSGARRRGLLSAVAWNTLIFVAALLLPGGGITSLASIGTSYFYFSLLSFAGLLILPVFNRTAVFTVDRMTQQSASTEEIGQLAACLDELSEGEPSRSATLESVFHPIPCVDRRIEVLKSDTQSSGKAWNVARTALFCSWAFGGPLARSVHCNIGRPELWVFLPSD